MVWIILLLMCCLKIVASEECNKTEIIVGRLGKEFVLSFVLSDLKDKYKEYISEHYGEMIIQNEIQMQDIKNESYLKFRNKMDSSREQIIYKSGKPNYWTGSRTEIFITNDAFVVKKTKLQKEDAGIYWIQFQEIRLGQKALVITEKPTFKGRSPPNPVLKPEDNYTSTIQLECHSYSTSIGDCPLPMYTVWYRNGMRMTDVDPTLSQINVTVDYNGGHFTCLVTGYLPCYQRLQTAQHFDVLNIEECNNVSESETFIVQPEYPPILKLDPDQREITVDTNDDLKVKCSAKCHPKCDVTWKKGFHDLKSNGSRFISELIIGNDLVIENANSSHEGYYGCLVNNVHGEVKKGFTLSVRETDNKAFNIIVIWIVIACVTVFVIAVTVIVIIVIMCKKYPKKKNESHHTSSEEEQHFYDSIDESSQENIADADSYELMELRQLPVTSGDNNSTNGESGTSRENNFRKSESGTSTDNNSRNGQSGTTSDNNSRNSDQYLTPVSDRYDSLKFNTLEAHKPDRVNRYTRLSQKHKPTAKDMDQEPGASTDNNSKNDEPGTSTDNNSRNSESGTSTDNNSINSDQYLHPVNDRYDSLKFRSLEAHKLDRVSRYTRLSQKHKPTAINMDQGNNSRNGESETSTDNNSINSEPGTSIDNNSRNGEPGTSRDNNSRNSESGTSTDNNSRNSEPGTSTDNNSRTGEPGTSIDNNSRNGEPGISRDNNSRNW